jgi:tRNA 2-selenouridine synthase
VTELPFQRERPDATVSPPLSLAELRGFDAILDARSPAEFAEDHLPGAISVPVLDDEERALVGTIYKEQSAFEAKRAGAPIVSRNIARQIETLFSRKPRGWKPLVYCWRGGGRSGSLTHVLRQVGWDAVRLEGGYKAFRKQVVADLEKLPARFRFRVICGATGSGKSRLLEALAETGAQALDLELLAAHRGSVLGELPTRRSRRRRRSRRPSGRRSPRSTRRRPVFVESESKKVGNLRVPDALITRMRESDCMRWRRAAGRVALLREDYAHFESRPAALAEKLECLARLHGGERIAQWKELLEAGDWTRSCATSSKATTTPRTGSRSSATIGMHIGRGDRGGGHSRGGFLTLARRLS